MQPVKHTPNAKRNEWGIEGESQGNGGVYHKTNETRSPIGSIQELILSK